MIATTEWGAGGTAPLPIHPPLHLPAAEKNTLPDHGYVKKKNKKPLSDYLLLSLFFLSPPPETGLSSHCLATGGWAHGAGRQIGDVRRISSRIEPLHHWCIKKSALFMNK